MGSAVHAYDLIQVRPRALLRYPVFERIGKKSALVSSNRHDITKEKSNVKGVLSPNARKRLKKAVNLLIASALPKPLYDENTGQSFDFLVNFITLTLPVPQDDITDDQLKRVCLNEWLIYAKRKYGLRGYVWKAETQANGNLHFHLTTDTYIHWSDIRKSWNHSLRHFGFIDRYREGMTKFHENGFQLRRDLLKSWDLQSQKRAYEYGVKTKWGNPNSTDVHAVLDINDLAAYIIKYMSKKEEGRRQVQGKVWGCSTNLLIKDKVEFDTTTSEGVQLAKTFADLEQKVFEDEYFSFIRLTDDEFNTYVTGKARILYEQLLEKVRNYEYTREEKPAKAIPVEIQPTEPRALDLFSV